MQVFSSAKPLSSAPQQGSLDSAPQIKLLQLRDQTLPALRSCNRQRRSCALHKPQPHNFSLSLPRRPQLPPRLLRGPGQAREEEPSPPRFFCPSPPGGSGAWHKLQQSRSFLELPSAGAGPQAALPVGFGSWLGIQRRSRPHGASGGAAALGGAGAALGGGLLCLRARR